MTRAQIFKVMNEGMGATETPEALLRHATRQRVSDNPAPRPEGQHRFAALFSVQEAF